MSAVVISGHFIASSRCPLYPRKRTSIERVGMSALCQKRTHALQQNRRYSLALSGREQLRWNFEAECFARPQLNQGLAWSVAATVALCSVHSPGPGLARMVAAMAASCSEHFPGLELAWFVPGTAAFCLEHSFGHSAARPSSGNTSCKLSIIPCAASPGTSRPRFPFAARHKAFAHPARTMLGGRFLSLQVSCRL